MTQAVETQREFLAFLGDELKQARLLRGWTQRDLTSRLPWAASVQTVASYERGTRHMPVARFVDVANALDQHPADLLTRAWKRAVNDLGPGLLLKLPALVEHRRDHLTPLRRWARCRLHDVPDGLRPVVLVSWSALTFLATLCAVDVDDLVQQLTDPSAGLVHSDGRQ